MPSPFRVRYHKLRRKWQALVTYKDEKGLVREKGRLFFTEAEAIDGMHELRKQYLGDSDQLSTGSVGNEYFDASGLQFRERKPYCCPSCNHARPFKNRRLIRGLNNENLTICRQCYKLGPEAVGNNLRKHSEALALAV